MMDRNAHAPDENVRGLPTLLDGLNLESSDRSLGSSLWPSASNYQIPPYSPPGTMQDVSRSPVPSPSRSASRSQARVARRVTSSGIDASFIDNEPGSTSSQFDPPSLRSIFASGQPTSSVSVNTAQASMSTASPGTSSRPFAALTNASTSRRRETRPTETTSLPGIVPQNTDYTMVGTEKDVDDPTMIHFGGPSDSLMMNTSQALSSLFATSERPTPGLSRETTYGRSASTLKLANDTSSLTGHLLQLGFEEGRHSDINIKAFGKSYRLHKLLLDRVPYFSSAFCGPWAESSASEMTLNPEDIDPNITQTAFELAIRRIYGTIVPYKEEQEAIGLFATGCWLDMPDLVESCIENILRQMHPSSLHVLIKLVTNSYYGKAGDRVLSSAKAMLCRDGWEMPYEYWDNVPADIIREIIGGDPFYIPSEWERWYLTLKILNRRLRRLAIEHDLVTKEGKYFTPPSTKLRSSAVRPADLVGTRRRGRKESVEDGIWRSLYAHAEVAPLLTLLDEGIHYVHLRFEQLQLIRSQKDILGIPLLPDKVISDALWMSMELRQRIVNAHEGDLELGLSQSADEEEDDDENEDEDEEADTPIALTRSDKGKQREHSEDSTNSSISDNRPTIVSTQPRKFWIPNNDVSCVMGGSKEAYAASTLGNLPDASGPYQRSAATPEITDSAWAADLGSSLFDTSLSTTRNFVTRLLPRYSHYPPFRFCAEFPNPRALKERKRVYSQTVWYAGSMWNLYIQRVNKVKNQQLGIFLHRAKDKESTDDPLALTVDDRIGQLEREMLMRRGDRKSRQWRTDTFTSLAELEQEEAAPSPLNDYEQLSSDASKPSSRPHKASQSPTQTRQSVPPLTIPQFKVASSETLPLSDSSLEPTLRQHASVSTIPPYTDARNTIKTYYKIYSPSKGGRLLSVYESEPDSFDFGKSWGWKSSWMVLDDGLDNKDGSRMVSGVGLGDGKLRYMVVIGNV